MSFYTRTLVFFIPFFLLFSLLITTFYSVSTHTQSSDEILVTTTQDADFATITNACTLRDALRAVYLGTSVGGCQATSVSSTVRVPDGVYKLTANSSKSFYVGNTLTPANFLEVYLNQVTRKVSIVGQSRDNTIIDANFKDVGLFVVPSRNYDFFSTPSGATWSDTASVSNLTVKNGRPNGYNCAAICSSMPNFNLENVAIQDNIFAGGGLVHYGPSLSLKNSIVQNNQGTFYTGGMTLSNEYRFSAFPAAIKIENSLIRGNKGCKGGGISLATGFSSWSPDYQISNTTITGNEALNCGGSTSSRGGGLYLPGGVIKVNTILVNSTLTDNSALYGANLYIGLDVNGNYGTGQVRFANNLLANPLVGTNCKYETNEAGYITGTWGNNLSSDSSCTTIFKSSTDQTNVANLNLQALTDNGGLVPTQALGSGSTAINSGSSTYCQPTDARGFTRPAGGSCDVGAFEYYGAADYVSMVTPNGGEVYQPGQLLTPRFRKNFVPVQNNAELYLVRVCDGKEKPLHTSGITVMPGGTDYGRTVTLDPITDPGCNSAAERKQYKIKVKLTVPIQGIVPEDLSNNFFTIQIPITGPQQPKPGYCPDTSCTLPPNTLA
jgi:hypothetical protein